MKTECERRPRTRHAARARRDAALRWLPLAAIAAAALMAGPAAAWRTTQFEIGAYCSDTLQPPPRRIVLANDAGLDWVAFWYQDSYATATHLLARLDSLRVHRPGFRMGAMLCYARPGQGHDPTGRLEFNIENPVPQAAIDSSLSPARGLNSRSTVGWAIWDEPCEAAHFANIGRISRRAATLPYAAHGLAYTNLLPIDAWDNSRTDSTSCYSRNFGVAGGYAKEDGYRHYLRRYFELFPGGAPPVVSIDHFAWQVPGHPQRDWFWNLRVLREECARVSAGHSPVPFWVVLQLSPFRPPNAAEFREQFGFVHTRWQVWSALAYGAKGITYWGLRTFDNRPREGVWGPGIFTDDGDTVAVRYSQVRALNRELHALGPTLMQLEPMGCWHADTLGWTGMRDERLDASHPSTIVGRFGPGADSMFAGWLRDRRRGRDYVMVVNKALATPVTCDVTLARRAERIARIDRSTGREVLVAQRTTQLHLDRLPAAQGELFRITWSAATATSAHRARSAP